MNRWSFWKKDGFVGLLVALVSMAGAGSGLMQSLDRKAYDIDVLAIGHLNSFPDMDGTVRTDPASQLYPYFYKDRNGRSAFPMDPFHDVFTGKIPAEKYRDRIMLIGASAAGLGTLQVAPVSPSMAQMGVFLLVALYLILLLQEHLLLATRHPFNKAESVFSYMVEYNPKFRNLARRLAQAREMAKAVILGGGGRTNASTMVPDKGLSRPMLGCYEIEKELGKGAMGVVYYGKDPKIGRVVAIKTMALDQEFDPDELQDVKERFFREAETAGRLNHPNIVSIYDAGEEHDLAYIAMEFLKGKDLAPFTKPDNLLPLHKVMSIIARVADALDYAHRQNVVHRDIKPANIMYDPETDTPKVTDFGMAHITNSSKTKTGMVLGTPSYMSPEQLAGRKIGGHSDLFSLGVSLYQLACGKLPFEGDSMAQLMYRIANEPPTDILGIRADLPPCLVAIINKSLSKPIEDRYANGAEMAEALRRCAAGLQG